MAIRGRDSQGPDCLGSRPARGPRRSGQGAFVTIVDRTLIPTDGLSGIRGWAMTWSSWSMTAKR